MLGRGVDEADLSAPVVVVEVQVVVELRRGLSSLSEASSRLG